MRIAALILLLLSGWAHADPQPWWPFRTLVTDHFEIVYREDQKSLAKRYALAAEQAYELLIPIFHEAPRKTTILLTDETDASNGEATFLPYPIIYVYPVLPSTLDSIDDYGDWPLEMIVHEYTHILNMYPAHGIYIPLKWIFGTVVRPNAILPKWYLEGLAVDMESRLTDHGRLRSSETQAAARILVHGKTLRSETLTRINEQELDTWPYGSRPYIFGGWWWNQVQSERGTGIIDTWNQNFARRIPFFLNGPMQEQTDRTAEELLASTHASLEQQATAQLTQLAVSPPQPSAPVAADQSGEQTVFAFSPSGRRFVYWVDTPHSPGSFGSTVYLKERSDARAALKDLPSKKLIKAPGTLRAQFLDEDRFIYDAIDTHAPLVSYRDLYIYDFKSGDSTRLTRGLRAQEAAPSAQGDKIAFIQNDGGRNRLMLLDTASGASHALLNGSFTQRLSTPQFLNDDELLFVLRQRSGKEQIMAYDFKTKKTAVWDQALKSVQNIRVTSKGLLATNADTNVRNAFLATPEGGEALSNTIGDIETVDLDPVTQDVVASELTPDGCRLVSFPYAIYHPATVEPFKIDPPPTPNTSKVKIHEASYQPIEYMLPHYWIPFLYPVDNGGLLFQGTTANSDPAGRNKYTLAASYDTITRKPSYGISYTNSSLPSDIDLVYDKAVSYLGASGRIVQSQYGSADIANYWPFNNRFTRWSIGDAWAETEGAGGNYYRTGPVAGLVYSRMEHPIAGWFGFHAEISDRDYLAQTGYLAYNRTYAHLGEDVQLGGGHHVSLHTRAALAPNLPFHDVVDLGDQSIGGNYLVSLINSDFLLRGYPSGAFVGRKMLNANLEYALPLLNGIGGWGTFPIFLRDLEFAVFADALSADGGGWDVNRRGYFRTSLDQFFMSSGGELRLTSTTAYHLPISLILGGYYGFTERFGGGFTPFLGIGMSGLNPLGH